MSEMAAISSDFDDFLNLGKLKLTSRVIVGTGRYKTLEQMQKCHEISGTQMVTVAMRRVSLQNTERSILKFIDLKNITILPNTSGAQTGEEVLRLGKIIKEMGFSHIKIEVTNDLKTLWPDPIETIRAVEFLRKTFSSEELFLMVYCGDDPIVVKKLIAAGADCIMPAGSPIGSGRGIQNPNAMKIIIDMINGKLPVILDAGIGCAADVTTAFEMGFDAVLLNSAIALAQKPEKMAEAVKYAAISGRNSFFAGRMDRKLYASASSPIIE